MVERPTRTFETFFQHVKSLGFEPEVCIDVGAANGTKAIYQAFPNALHIAFEPLPEFRTGLEKCLSEYRSQIHTCALMDEDGEIEILRSEQNPYGSSLMHRRHDSGDERLLRVPVRRLDGVLQGHDLTGQVLLKTDCQGADLFVVKGGVETVKACDIVILETSFFRFWGDHHPDFAEIVAYMKDRNFVVYDILDGLFRPSDNALGQVDLVFAKRDGFLRRLSKW